MVRGLAFMVACAALCSQSVTQLLGGYDREAWHTGRVATWQHVGVALAVLVLYTGGWQVWARVRGERASG